ncbi:MAG TPA: hypothetical protein VH116_04860 [Gemmatimonadales bacterium]|nr:hypothetical protein [Gemmatimonadales bacterium]
MALRAPRHLALSVWLATLAVALGPRGLAGQDNFEIQVYGADLVASGRTMLELHSNFTAHGRRAVVDSLWPSDHALHETFELTHGITPWFEVGSYLFTSVQSGGAWTWVGSHLRPRLRAPEAWHWPVGASLSFEFGYQRRAFSADTWTLEIRPIVDHRAGPWYWALNPALERSLRGEAAAQGFTFAPTGALSYDVTPAVTLGVEYYASLGPVTGFDRLNAQQHQLFPALDLNLSPSFEFNLGVGLGLTPATDRLIIKMITGYRF